MFGDFRFRVLGLHRGYIYIYICMGYIGIMEKKIEATI